MEYNRIYDVLLESDDGGAFYTGRDPTGYGCVIRNNYAYRVGSTNPLYTHGYPSMGINVYIENVPFLENGALQAGEHKNITKTLDVKDGFLTLTSFSGSTSSPSINYIKLRKVH